MISSKSLGPDYELVTISPIFQIRRMEFIEVK